MINKSYNYTSRGRKPSRDWSKVGFSLSNTELAETLNMSKGNIPRLRRRYAPETLSKNGGRRLTKFVDWKNLDWSKRNMDLAEEVGFSRCYVSQKRREHSFDTLQKKVWNNW